MANRGNCRSAAYVLLLLWAPRVLANPGDVLLTLPPPIESPGWYGWSVDAVGNDIVVGSPLATVDGRLRGGAFVFDGNTGEVLASLSNDGFVQRTPYFGNTVIAIGDNVVGVTENRNGILFFDSRTGAFLSRSAPYHIDPLASNDTLVFAAFRTRDGEVRATDVRTGEVVRSFHNPEPELKGAFPSSSIAVTEQFLIGSSFDVQSDGERGRVYVFDVESGDYLFPIRNPDKRGSVFGGSISTTDDKILVSDRDRRVSGNVSAGRVYAFDMSTGEHLFSIDNPDPEEHEDFGRELVGLGQNIVAAETNDKSGMGSVYIFDGRTAELLMELVSPPPRGVDIFGSALGVRDKKDLIISSFGRQEVFVVEGIATSCDINHDRVCDVLDVDALSVGLRDGADESAFDLDVNGQVDQRDHSYWIKYLGRTSAGDANFDRQFTSGDLVQVFQSAEYEDGRLENSTWSQGDWNGDGEFDSSDLVVAFQSGKYETGPIPVFLTVPETGGQSLFALTVWFLIATRELLWYGTRPRIGTGQN